jgi:hypothetical protein
MAIRVRHEDLASQMQGGLAVGGVVGASKGLELDTETTKFLLRMKQQDDQFNTQTQLRLDDQRLSQQRHQAEIAARSAQGILQAKERQAAREAEFATRQMQNEYGLLEQQAGFGNEWAMQGVQSLDDQVKEQLKLANGMKLNPEGRRIKDEWAGKLRQVQSQRNILRPDAYNAVLGQAMAEFEQLGLDAYEEREPSQEEWLASTTYTLPNGTIIGKDRSGMPRVLEKAPFQPLSPKEIEENTYTYPDGSRLFVNPRTGKEIWKDPVKPEKSEQEPKQPIVSAGDQVRRDKHIADLVSMAYENDPKNYTFDKMQNKVFKKSFYDYFQENQERIVADFNRRNGDPDEGDLTPSELKYELTPQFDRLDRRTPAEDAIEMPFDTGGGPGEEAIQELGGEDERPIVTNPAGRRAYLNPDGTVEPID